MSPWLLYLVFVTALLRYVLYVWRRRQLYGFARLCAVPPGWPIVGNALHLAGDQEQLVQKISEIGREYHGKRVLVWIFTRPILLVQTPDDARAVLTSQNCLAKHEYYEIFELLVGHGLFTAPTEKWRRHRRLLMPAFNKRTLDSYVPVIARHAARLVHELSAFAGTHAEPATVDLQPHLSMFTFHVFCETAMGLHLDGSYDQAKFLFCIERLKNAVFDRMFNIRSIGYYLNKKHVGKDLQYYVDFVRDFTKNVIRIKRSEMQQRKMINGNDEQQRLSFLELLLELTGADFTEQDCCDEVTTFLIGGSDTTSTTVGFALLALGMSQEVQKAVHAELDEVFADRDLQATVEISDLPRLVYLERVIKETMRLFPVSVVVARECSSHVRLSDGAAVPPGVDIALLLYNLHRCPDAWPNPLDFNPDRFLTSESTKRHPYSYVPFSAGPRNCIGAGFAMASMKVALATVLRSYHIQARVGTDPIAKPADLRIEMCLVTKPVDGFIIQLIHRNHLKPPA